ncbi:PepSY-associated TM helix domain-containing protein [Fortiea contorta]|uniref:PepSY-associated TM helix domain-containing protein n=1 Tax=Fortiea contorta TaxID=1892405 RepID=UPI00034C4B3F|nr:PepSY-associated TM helix domain-containing protein [Fortiea contorta]
MNSKPLRNTVFYLHRYIGLFVGLILIIVGLTGSLLVFQKELNQFQIRQEFGQVIPQEQRVPIDTVLENIKTSFASQPNFKLSGINTPPDPHIPYRAFLQSPKEERLEVFVNPYTGVVMGSRQWEKTIIGLTYKLHYQLLAGDIGQIIVGIAALLLLILSITGIVLWPGWRKLIAGFKIKLQAHPKRVNFDIHKVTGVVAAVFLTMIAFTGFCWNFYDQAQPTIHAVTFTPIRPTPVSQPIAGKSALSLTEILPKADAALPGAITTFIRLPQKPDGVFLIGKKLPQENSDDYGESRVYLNQYTGEILQLTNGLKLSRADHVLSWFTPMHYGTFGGLTTRILYVFVGIAPLILLFTGFVMYRYHRQDNLSREQALEMAKSVK